MRTAFWMAAILSNLGAHLGADIMAGKVALDLSVQPLKEDVFKEAKEEVVTLMAQPMVAPRPATTLTPEIRVRAVHDGHWIAFLLTWADTERSEAGRLGEFSDAVALEFPVKEEPLPPIFMGTKDMPVHLLHWRAQYQRDREKGPPEMKDLYPNMNPDMYPMDFKDQGKLQGISEEMREVYSHGKAAGNPQSYRKESAVDEIFAEGFGSSSIIHNPQSHGEGRWSDGRWAVVLARPLALVNGSVLVPGQPGHIGLAVWQGGQDEVGARKCVTMSWITLLMAGE